MGHLRATPLYGVFLLSYLALVVVLPTVMNCHSASDEPRTFCATTTDMMPQIFFVCMVIFFAAECFYSSELVRLAREIKQKGVASQAAVITIAVDRLNCEETPGWRLPEYACLVEFQLHFLGSKIFKWVKIDKRTYMDLQNTGVLITKLSTDKTDRFPKKISNKTLNRCRGTNGNAPSITIHSMSEYPKSAVSNDPTVYGLRLVIALILLVALTVNAVCLGISWYLFVLEYNGKVFDAGWKLVLLVVTNVYIAVLCFLLASQDYKERRRVILEEEVEVTEDSKEAGQEENEQMPLLV